MKYLIVALLTTLITSCSSTENSKKTVVLENPGTHGTIFATGEAYAKSRDEAIEKALLNAVRKASPDGGRRTLPR